MSSKGTLAAGDYTAAVQAAAEANQDFVMGYISGGWECFSSRVFNLPPPEMDVRACGHALLPSFNLTLPPPAPATPRHPLLQCPPPAGRAAPARPASST